MRGGLVTAVLLLLVAFDSAPAPALAASEVEIRHAADGTLVVVGSGWHHGVLQITLGPDRFTAYADATGDFEVATGLATYTGDLAVHHVSFGRPQPAAVAPSPLGAALAQSVLEGCALLALAAAAAGLGAKLKRRRHRPR